MINKILGALLIVTLTVVTCSAQDIKVLGGDSFEYANTTYNRYTLRSVMERKPEALVQYDRYINVLQNTKRERLVGSLLMVVGGFATYRGIINSLGNGADETLAYTGLAGFLIGSGLVIASLRQKQHILNEAIDIYNNSPPPLGIVPYLELGLTANGLGLVYQF